MFASFLQRSNANGEQGHSNNLKSW